MADLVLDERLPADGLGLPVEIGAARLAQAPWRPVVSLMPRRGRTASTSKALEAATGLPLPPAGRTERDDAVEVAWMGLGQWFTMGIDPARLTPLAEHAALTDQSDAWAHLHLTGATAGAVLARLCPLDLDPVAFPLGATARTEFAHMMSAITALENGYRIMVMRSFARTAVEDLSAAMRSAAARAMIA